MSTLPTDTPGAPAAELPADELPRAPRRRPWAGKAMGLAGLLMLCVGFVMPFVWMLSTSLKTNDITQKEPPRFLPEHVSPPDGKGYWDGPEKYWQPGNYDRVLRNEDGKFNFALFARNTLVIAGLTVLGTTLSSALVAYGFAKIRFKGRGVLFAVMLATMMIPFPVTMVSLFVIFRWLGDHTPIQFLGTFRPLWVPAWFGSAFNIFLLRQFFITVPDELSEAARIDGCTDWGIFWRIMLPLSRPALAVVALFTFMHAWNDYMGPLIYLQRPEQYTLSLGLQAFQSQHGGTEWNLLMAASVLVVAPVIVLFFLTQRTFIQGIATTGMKG